MTGRQIIAKRLVDRQPYRAGRRGKPSIENRGFRRNWILSAGRQVFAVQGYERATLTQIARLAQVDRKLIRYHFGNKESLYAAVQESNPSDLSSSKERGC